MAQQTLFASRSVSDTWAWKGRLCVVGPQLAAMSSVLGTSLSRPEQPKAATRLPCTRGLAHLGTLLGDSPFLTVWLLLVQGKGSRQDRLPFWDLLPLTQGDLSPAMVASAGWQFGRDFESWREDSCTMPHHGTAASLQPVSQLQMASLGIS